MSDWPAGEPKLDFIVIGTQKGGTTSLWQYLRRHPQIAMPDYKEVPAFCAREEVLRDRLGELMRESFEGAPAGARLGKVSTHYMMGLGSVDVDRIAERIARALPEVRLIALLRDPIERAMSHYRMSVRREIESRAFEVAAEEQLAAGAIETARARPTETNSYLVQGEYGRILAAYRQRFPREQIHVELTGALQRSPGPAIDRVLAFLGLQPGYRPPDLGRRYHRGGTSPRLDAEGVAHLRGFMEESVWPPLGDRAAGVKHAFEFFLETWNVVPDDRRPDLSDAGRRRLEAHYRADAELLAELGVEVDWLDRWAAA